jgi:phage terminase small subunit
MEVYMPLKKKKDNVTNISEKQAAYLQEILGGRLDPKEEIFCREFAASLDMAAAYITAYYPTQPGYSKQLALAAATRKLEDPRITKAIKKHIAARHDRIGLTGDKVLAEIGLIGFSNIKSLFDENGALKNISDLPDEIARTIQEYKVTPGGAASIKMYSKQPALEKLGNYLGLFDNNNIKDIKEIARQIRQAVNDMDASVLGEDLCEELAASSEFVGGETRTHKRKVKEGTIYQ